MKLGRRWDFFEKFDKRNGCNGRKDLVFLISISRIVRELPLKMLLSKLAEVFVNIFEV